MKILNVNLIKALCFTTGVLFCSFSGGAQEKENTKNAFTVGVAGSSPFVTGEGNQQGISVELWEEIAQDLGLQYKSKTFEDIPMALEALKSGEIDAIVGPVSITAERSKEVVFSQPYYESGLSILSRPQEPTLWDRVKPFFNTKFFIALGTFLFILAVVGLFLWLAERKNNPDEFSSHPLKGIGDGMWLAIVTMTTTGYGDMAPKSTLGRFVAGSWMVISLTFLASMLAGISSTLTLTGMGGNTIDTAKELHGKKTAVFAKTPSADFVEKYGGVGVKIENLEEGYALLMDGAVQAIVYDRPQLQSFIKTKPEESLSLSATRYMPVGYGFALAKDSLIGPLNTALLSIRESGEMRRIKKSWLGEAKE